jgi:hypothetical protein
VISANFAAKLTFKGYPFDSAEHNM